MTQRERRIRRGAMLCLAPFGAAGIVASVVMLLSAVGLLFLAVLSILQWIVGLL